MIPPNRQLSEEEESTLERRHNRAVKLAQKIQDNCEGVSMEGLRRAFSIDSLEKLVATRPHSVTAKEILESARLAESGMDALNFLKSLLEGIEGKVCVRVVKKLVVKVATSLADAMRKTHDIIYSRKWNEELLDLATTTMSTLCSDASQDKKIRADALLVHAMLLRYFCQEEQADTQALQKCRLAHILNPQDPYILLAEGMLHSHQNDDFDAWLKTVEKAASLCGDDEPEITLFYRAMAVRAASGSHDKKHISLLEEYVECSEPDARELPEALYQLAAIYGQQGLSAIGKAKRYFAMAEQAEERSLPLGEELPGLISLREATRTFLKNYAACGNEKCSAAAEQRCSGCKLVCYCSEDCRNADWPSHKAFCKKHRKGKHRKASEK